MQKRWGNDGRAGYSWGGGGNDKPADPSGSDESDKCKRAKGRACCNQPEGRLAAIRDRVCNVLGCNLKKCGKRTDGFQMGR
jgi:hypothetical protein